ncbi:MAG: hypothetical protein KY442_10960 [Proteobacteria bacterium]|nr:hypothetical protein [Pseudomonadota bacterium]
MSAHDQSPARGHAGVSEDERRILRERARRLAAAPPPGIGGQSIEVLEFGLADERYAFEAGHVHDVQPLRR